MGRFASKRRDTKETQIEMSLNLDGSGTSDIDTGIGFFDHMLTLFAFHSGFDLVCKAKGDLYVDDHHMIEDCGILLGELFQLALGDKRGIARYGSMRMVMDETLCTVDADISGRPYLVFHADFQRESINGYSLEMTKEFFYAFVMQAKVTLHINLLYGDNDHHKVEAMFKGLARALKQAIQVEGTSIPSSKGVIQ
ncbi:imidazoleglycerol-phosphate dehydratase [Erysipelotrichaceae bacterium MTC7]|nr:imidazoleglycerol-phosphate dehydratase [Erysipelotrichaceae bacterium MTC7]